MVKSHIVVARFNEDLDWLKDAFNQDDVYIYNKGAYLKASEYPRQWRIGTLPNVGRETHTYLHHIIQHYDKLADVTVFIQGRIDDHIQGSTVNEPVPFLWQIAKEALEFGVSKNTTHVPANIRGAPSPSFKLVDWAGSKIRDSGMKYGEWFESFVGQCYPAPSVKFMWYGAALFAASKQAILQHPKAYYQRLFSTVHDHNNPEEGHFMERSWYYIMKPIKTVDVEYVALIISHHGNKHLWDTLLTEYNPYRHTFVPLIISADPTLNSEFYYQPNLSTVKVKCDDTYDALSQKVALAMKAAATLFLPRKGIFKIDDDVFVNFERLQKALPSISLETKHFCGIRVGGNRWCDFHKSRVTHPENQVPVFIPDVHYCGGPFYMLSPDALNIFTNYLDTLEDTCQDPDAHLYEDVNMGRVLQTHGKITPTHVTLYVDDVEDDISTTSTTTSIYNKFLDPSSESMIAFHDKFHRYSQRHYEHRHVEHKTSLRVDTPLNTFLCHSTYYDPMISPLVNKPKPILGQSEPYIVYLYQKYQDIKGSKPEYTVAVPVHDQEGIIVRNLQSIFTNTTGSFELLMVFDGCTDASERLVLSYLQSKDWSKLPHIHRICVIHQHTSIFETACDNMMFRLAQGQYIVEIQADMQIMTYGYNYILTKPMRIWNDIIAVSGKAAHKYFKWLNGNGIGRIYNNQVEEPLHLRYEDMDVFYEWETCNRGPMVLDALKLKELGYLDEQNYVLGDDDHDLMARAWSQKQWRCGYVPLEVYMPMAHGSMRKPMHEKDKVVIETRKKRATTSFLESLRQSNKYVERELKRHVMDNDAILFGIQKDVHSTSSKLAYKEGYTSMKPESKTISAQSQRKHIL